MFGWKTRADFAATAYEIEVRDAVGACWSSGRIEGSGGVDIAYRGPALASNTSYAWTATCWSEGGEVAFASGEFETSILSNDEWSAAWLVPAQLSVVRERYAISELMDGTAHPPGPAEERLHPPLQVRQGLTLNQVPVRARLYASARGVYEVEINGDRIGDEILAPGFDTYARRLSFQSYDVTSALRAGENIVGLTVADGWYAGRIGITGSSAPYGDELAVIWQLSMDFADGSRRTIRSGDSPARSSRGGWDYADLFIGERFDARALTKGWSAPGYDASSWDVVTVKHGGTDVLVPFTGEPIRRTESIESPAQRLDDSTYLVDVGQVIAGRMRLRFRAERGTEIVLEHSEVLLPDGSFFDNIVGPNKDQRDSYVAAGGGEEAWEPSFTFHGFRYVRVSGDAPFELIRADAQVIGSDMPVTSALATSDPRLDALHRNIVWSQRGNFLFIPTDCRQRERAGWTGDFQVYAPAASANMDIRAFAERWLDNVRAEQREDGSIPPVVPVIPTMLAGDDSDIHAAAGWSDAIVLVPWTLYRRYGDRRVLEDNYQAMRRWVDYAQHEAERRIPTRVEGAAPDVVERHRRMWNTGWQFGDWLVPSVVRQGDDPVDMAKPSARSEIVTAMYHAHTTAVTANIAEELGREGDAADLGARAAAVRTAFAQEYIADDGRLMVDMQGTYVLALAFDLVPAQLVDAAARRLVELLAANDDHLDTGFLSTPYLLDVLWEAGHRELARRVLWQTTTPSWLYQVDTGATTIWESWEAVQADGTPTLSSMNHYAFGSVDDWIVRRQVGIAPLEPGYSRTLIAPDFHGPLSAVDYVRDTVRGPLAVCWNRERETVRLVAKVPAGMTAEVRIGASRSVVGPGRHEWSAERGAAIGYVTIYATDTLGLEPAAIGTILLVSKVIDAVGVLFAGWFVDRAPETRIGKARPFEFAIIGAWASVGLLFSVPGDLAEIPKYAWLLAAYLLITALFGPLITANDPLYLARAFGNRDAITRVSTRSGIVTGLFAVVTAISLPLLLNTAGKDPGAWTSTIWMLSVPLGLFGLIRFFVIKEKHPTESADLPRVSFRDIVTVLRSNPYLWSVAGINFLSSLAMAGTVGTYYFRYIIGDLAMLSLVGVFNMLLLPLLLIVPKLVRKLSISGLIAVPTSSAQPGSCSTCSAR